MKSRKKKTAALGSNVVHPNVSRVDYAQNHGYNVRIQRKGKEFCKLFSDSVYGGKRKAKQAAIAWREETIKQVGVIVFGSRGQPANPPGYSYVKRMPTNVTTSKGTQEVMCWMGFLRIEDRKHVSTKWSIPKWGDEQAKAGCEAWLKEKKAELAARLGHSIAETKPSQPPAPKAETKATQLAFEQCEGCGGVVRLRTGPGRTYWYDGRLEVPVPDDFPTETCAGCGELYMTDREADALDKRIAQTLPNKRTKRARKVAA